MRLSAVLPTLALVLLLPDPAPAGADDEPKQAAVFVSGEGGYHTYRIPAVVASPKGVLLAFCEGRKASAGDTGDIDVVLRRSQDGGRTWQRMGVVADDGRHTIGNPCPVVDRMTGTVWLLLTRNHGQDRQPEIEEGTSREPRTVWVCKSSDDGATWSEPVEISKTTRRPDWGWYGTGPCNGIQLKAGRLVIPCHHTPARTHTQQAHVIYSDDHGRTWRLGGALAGNTGESTVAELADGTLLMSVRNHPRLTGRRTTAVSKDRGESWSEPVLDETLVGPGCQGSLLRFTTKAGAGKDRLLFSNPASRKREKMTVRLSYDEGKTWPVARELHAGPSGYSCLTVLPDRRIGCLYERGKERPYGEVRFAAFSLGWLSEGRDALRE